MKALLVALGLFILRDANAEQGLIVKKGKETVNVQFESAFEGWATLEIKDKSGDLVLEQQMAISEGANDVPVFFISKLKKGTYSFVLKLEDKVYSTQYVKE
jgi:hypothetical protein